MRTLLVLVTLAIVTPWYAAIIAAATLIGVQPRDQGFYQRAARGWNRWLVRAAGVRVVTHGMERIAAPTPRVLVANHVSWFDVFALATALPRFAFVAKAELERVPLFGRAARSTGTVFIARENRKAAFAVYEKAAERIRAGATVVIFPEGTRGHGYALRPFKKGPFVLAIAAGAPVVPVLVYGTVAIHPRGGRRVRSGEVHIHVLDEVPTADLSYDDRDTLAREVHARLRAALRELYQVESPEWRPASRGVVAETGSLS
jgi:1-acyl-sn-glycerol-3-phosphate acyltransferase